MYLLDKDLSHSQSTLLLCQHAALYCYKLMVSAALLTFCFNSKGC